MKWHKAKITEKEPEYCRSQTRPTNDRICNFKRDDDEASVRQELINMRIVERWAYGYRISDTSNSCLSARNGL